MFDFSETILQNIVVHNVGNATNNEGFQVSKQELNLENDILKSLLLNYFLSPFKTEVFFNFAVESEQDTNLMYEISDSIFENPSSFYEKSLEIAEFLYEKSIHPKIKKSEFYVVYLRNCVVDSELVDAIGLFKSENKDTYLKVNERNQNFEIEYESGINIHKLDKGCLIFNTEREHGYKVSIIDAINKSSEAFYWKDEFLKIKQREDNFYNTKTVIDMCKGFTKQMKNEQEITKKEQIDFIKNTEKYFTENEVFDNQAFAEEVLIKPEIVESFKKYKSSFEEEKNLSLEDGFEISGNAVKDSKGFFRSVLKLDRNFHVYVHSKPEFLERGFDNSKGMNFYKLYYEEEK